MSAMKFQITRALCIIVLPLLLQPAHAQDSSESDHEADAFFIRGLYQEALASQHCYTILSDLIETCGGHRLSGTANYDRAVAFFNQRLKAIGFSHVYNQSCEVVQWQRGTDDAVVYLDASGTPVALSAVALGNSGHSNGKMLYGEIIPFNHIDSLELYEGDLTGKIAFFTRPFDASLINTFRAYSGAVAQRVFGPNAAAKRGAVACIVRSMASNTDDHPHTGVTVFEDDVTPIPAMAISTLDADKLLAKLQNRPITGGVLSDSREVGTTTDDNIVAEIKGSEYPDEIILAGGHLDSWDIGKGAHDDGSGCAHAAEAFRLLLSTGYQPKRTWRCVLFANEENGLAGGLEYARISNEKGEFHLAAIESDAGGFTPKAFSFAADTLLSAYMRAVQNFWPMLEAYNLDIEFTGSGADISPLRSQQGLLIGLRPDPQRYFDYHHSTNDNLEHVHPRELSMGAAAIASLIYLIDQYGLPTKE